MFPMAGQTAEPIFLWTFVGVIDKKIDLFFDYFPRATPGVTQRDGKEKYLKGL